MYEVTLSDGVIVSFDGRVVEMFGRHHTRLHIDHVTKAEAKPGRKHNTLHVDANPFGGFMLHYGQLEEGSVRRLVEEILKAKKAPAPSSPFYDS
jgi:hypothetical protein